MELDQINPLIFSPVLDWAQDCSTGMILLFDLPNDVQKLWNLFYLKDDYLN